MKSQLIVIIKLQENHVKIHFYTCKSVAKKIKNKQ